MTVKLTTYDPANDLTSDTAIATFIAEAYASGDAAYIAHAIDVVTHAQRRRRGLDLIDVARDMHGVGFRPYPWKRVTPK